MHRRSFSTCRSLAGHTKPRKKTHWADEIRHLNNVTRALSHYDDFYASVYGQQWPSLRIGLLSPPKYMAIPNSFTGNIDGISEKLESLGAYNVKRIWMEKQAILDDEKKDIDLKKDLGRLHKMERTLESIAATKKAEELDLLYQNAPTSKREDMRLIKGVHGRVISNAAEAMGDFVPSTKLKGVDDFTFDSEYFSSYVKNTEEDSDEGSNSSTGQDELNEIQFVKSHDFKLEIPKLMQPFTFENGSPLNFPPSGREPSTGLREYICINGSSILPVIALDLNPGVNLLDLCAGPGTKSLLALMTMAINSITCNDLESSRILRVKHIFQEFTGSSTPPNVMFTKVSGADYPSTEKYSRVLADVPCLNDRVSCTVVDNNIFKPKRMKERLSLVKIQKNILLSGMRTLDMKLGSAIVYSTCTLSPIENDGVVLNALKETETMDLHVDLIGLMNLIRPFEKSGMFRIMRTRCGVLVLPNTFCNFGPMYISRMVVNPREVPDKISNNIIVE